MNRFDFMVDSDEHGQEYQLQGVESDVGRFVLYEDATAEIRRLRVLLKSLTTNIQEICEDYNILSVVEGCNSYHDAKREGDRDD